MMNDEQKHFNKIRRLTLALIVSGTLNIAIGGFFFYWLLRERPPTPYFEQQPVASIHELPPLTDQRSIADLVALYKKLTFEQLAAKLHNEQLVEDGYSQRDIALASLKSFHFFDLQRALQGEAQPTEERSIICKKSNNEIPLTLTVYPGLTDRQFQAITQFAYTERWPVTAEGLFLLLQKENLRNEPTLAEAFYLTSEFGAVQTLFSRAEVKPENNELLGMIVDGDWNTLAEFTKQQRISQDLSPAKREKLLLDNIDKGSKGAAYLLLKTDPSFAAKKLDDKQVLSILLLLKDKTPESEAFALSLLKSPRSLAVCQQAAFRLYEYSDKPIPNPWNYEAALATFAPQRLLVEKVQKAVAAEAPIKKMVTTPVKVFEPVRVAAKVSDRVPDRVSQKVSDRVPEKGKIVFSTSPTKQKDKAVVAEAASYKPNVTAPANERLYVVQDGDSLWKISRRQNVDMDVIRKMNGLKSDALKPGMTLKLPGK